LWRIVILRWVRIAWWSFIPGIISTDLITFMSLHKSKSSTLDEIQIVLVDEVTS
jgi:hypothetical protein